MSSKGLVLTQANYSYDEYIEALQAYAVAQKDAVYTDLLDAFIYEWDSRRLDVLITNLSAVIDEDEDGAEWQGAAGKLAAKVRELLEDLDQ